MIAIGEGIKPRLTGEIKTGSYPALGSSNMGIVYVLTNPAFGDYVKVGTTTKLPQRLRQLDNTSVPLPFRCEFAVEVEDEARVERLVHQAFADHRTRTTLEFFEVNPQRVIAALKLAGGKEVTPKDDIAADDEGLKAFDKATRTKSSRGRLTDAGLKIGDTLHFSKDETITAEVVSDRAIRFEGKETSPSTAALTVLHRLGYKWKTTSGFQQWMFEDETLAERIARLSKEAQETDDENEGDPETVEQAEG